MCSPFFFFNDTATTEIYTLSLHDALPISGRPRSRNHAVHARYHSSAPLRPACRDGRDPRDRPPPGAARHRRRSEEHTSELQSQSNLVCRLLLEKKKGTYHPMMSTIYSQ